MSRTAQRAADAKRIIDAIRRQTATDVGNRPGIARAFGFDDTERPCPHNHDEAACETFGCEHCIGSCTK